MDEQNKKGEAGAGLNEFGIDENGVYVVDLRDAIHGNWLQLAREGKLPEAESSVKAIYMDFTSSNPEVDSEKS